MKRTDELVKAVFGFAVISAFCLLLLAAVPKEKWPKPQYDAKGNLLRPADYRDWEFLSAGYGMNYSSAPGSHEMFTNVFVQRWAYVGFLKSGKWPEQSMFVIDERDAESKGSINKKGHFQTDLMGLAARGESEKQFPWRMFRRKIALWRWERGVASRKNSGLQLAPWRALPAIRFMSG